MPVNFAAAPILGIGTNGFSRLSASASLGRADDATSVPGFAPSGDMADRRLIGCCAGGRLQPALRPPGASAAAAGCGSIEGGVMGCTAEVAADGFNGSSATAGRLSSLPALLSHPPFAKRSDNATY